MFKDFTHTLFARSVASVVIVAFLTMIPAQSGYAQVLSTMPAPGQMVHPTGAFDPALMLGLKVDLKDPFNFYFIMDKGQVSRSESDTKAEYQKLVKYFLAAITTPNKDMWVNLSPIESDRIIPDALATTDMGADMLAQDYLLKQFTASLMYPEDAVGQEFWRKIYEKAYTDFGTTDIPVDTFNKVWITADRANIYQKDDSAFLVDSHLKVMLEQDFMAIEQNKEQFGNVGQVAAETDGARKIASDIVREVIVPIIEKEVNEGQNFAQVRQIYSSMILATWFKKTLREGLLGQVYADQNKVAGVEGGERQAKEKIYQQYLEAYKVGVFNYIKEEADPVTKEMMPRKYFSGGFKAVDEQAIDTDPVKAQRVMNEKKKNSSRASGLTNLLMGVTVALFSVVPGLLNAQDTIAFQNPAMPVQEKSMMAAENNMSSVEDTVSTARIKVVQDFLSQQLQVQTPGDTVQAPQVTSIVLRQDDAKTVLYMHPDGTWEQKQMNEKGDMQTIATGTGLQEATAVMAPQNAKTVFYMNADGTWEQKKMNEEGEMETITQGTGLKEATVVLAPGLNNSKGVVNYSAPGVVAGVSDINSRMASPAAFEWKGLDTTNVMQDNNAKPLLRMYLNRDKEVIQVQTQMGDGGGIEILSVTAPSVRAFTKLINDARMDLGNDVTSTPAEKQAKRDELEGLKKAKEVFKKQLYEQKKAARQKKSFDVVNQKAVADTLTFQALLNAPGVSEDTIKDAQRAAEESVVTTLNAANVLAQNTGEGESLAGEGESLALENAKQAVVKAVGQGNLVNAKTAEPVVVNVQAPATAEPLAAVITTGDATVTEPEINQAIPDAIKYGVPGLIALLLVGAIVKKNMAKQKKVAQETSSETSRETPKEETEPVVTEQPAASETQGEPVVVAGTKSVQQLKNEEILINPIMPALVLMQQKDPGLLFNIAEKRSSYADKSVIPQINTWVDANIDALGLTGKTKKQVAAFKADLTRFADPVNDPVGIIRSYKNITLAEQIDGITASIASKKQAMAAEGLEQVVKEQINEEIQKKLNEKKLLDKKLEDMGKIVLLLDVGPEAKDQQPSVPVASVPAVTSVVAPAVETPAEFVLGEAVLGETVLATPERNQQALEDLGAARGAVQEFADVVVVKARLEKLRDTSGHETDIDAIRDVLTAYGYSAEVTEANAYDALVGTIYVLTAMVEALQKIDQETPIASEKISDVRARVVAELKATDARLQELSNNFLNNIPDEQFNMAAFQGGLNNLNAAKSKVDGLSQEVFKAQEARISNAILFNEIERNHVEFAVLNLAQKDLMSILNGQTDIGKISMPGDVREDVAFLMSLSDPEAAVYEMLAGLEEELDHLKTNPDGLSPERLQAAVTEDLGRLTDLRTKMEDVLGMAIEVPQAPSIAEPELGDRSRDNADAGDKLKKDIDGGINLSDAHLTMNIKVDGAGMPLPARFQDPAMTNIQGLSPIIREIAPLMTSRVPALAELLAP